MDTADSVEAKTTKKGPIWGLTLFLFLERRNNEVRGKYGRSSFPNDDVVKVSVRRSFVASSWPPPYSVLAKRKKYNGTGES